MCIGVLLGIRDQPRSTRVRSSAGSDVYKGQAPVPPPCRPGPACQTVLLLLLNPGLVAKTNSPSGWSRTRHRPVSWPWSRQVRRRRCPTGTARAPPCVPQKRLGAGQLPPHTGLKEQLVPDPEEVEEPASPSPTAYSRTNGRGVWSSFKLELPPTTDNHSAKQALGPLMA